MRTRNGGTQDVEVSCVRSSGDVTERTGELPDVGLIVELDSVQKGVQRRGLRESSIRL